MGHRMGSATETRRALALSASMALIHSSRAFVCPLVRSSASIVDPPSYLGVAVASPITSRTLSLQQQQHLPRQQCAPQSAPEDGTKEVGAGAGMGLDGDWQVVSGEGSGAQVVASPSRGASVDAVPGMLPETTVDGQDWGEWAREWREDPGGKADRLVKQWEAESGEGAESAGRDFQSGGGVGGAPGGKSKRKSKRKSSSSSSSNSSSSVSRGFGGGNVRATKSVPKGLVVTETDVDAGGGGQEAAVDWSKGQTLAETNRERDFAAQWQEDAETLQNLNPSDRDALAKNLRQALGKTTKSKKKKSSSKKNRKTSSPVTNEGPPGGAFDSSSVAGGGKGFGSSGAGGSGARGSAAAAAAAAAGGQQEKGKNKGALGDAAATPAPEKTGQRVVSLAGGEGSAEGTRFSDGVAAVLGRKESVTVPASVDAGREGTPDISGTYDEDASGGGGVEVGDENASSQGEEHEAGVGEEAAATRVMAFGRGVAVVPDGDRGSGPEKKSRDHHARTFGGGVATAVPASSPVDASSPVSASSSVDAPPLADVSSPESEENKGITGGGTGGGRIPSFGGGVAIPGKDE